MSSANAVVLKGGYEQKELVAAAAITPGMLVYVDSAGKVAVHATAGGTAMAAFLLVQDLDGDDLNDACTSGDTVKFGIFAPGAEVNALLADGENAAIGNWLESNGDGYLRVVDTDTSVADVGVGSIVGQALEALDMSDSSGADPTSQRIKILVK